MDTTPFLFTPFRRAAQFLESVKPTTSLLACGPLLALVAAGATANVSSAQEPLSYTWGSDSAAVVVVEFLDFGCGACATFHRESYATLFREYVTTGKVRWTLVPFVTGQFVGSMEATEAASCAARQPGGLTVMTARLFDTQAEWMAASDRRALFSTYAEELGLDGAELANCLAERRTEAGIRAAGARALELGVRATPTLFMDGFPIAGALPLAFFRELFDKQIARSSGVGESRSEDRPDGARAGHDGPK